MDTQMVPKKKKWATWKIVVGVIVILVVAGSIGGFVATKAPTDEARAYTADLTSGNYQAAYDRSYSEVKLNTSLEAFSEEASKFSAFSGVDPAFNERTIEGNSARVTGSMINTKGQKVQIGFQLIKTNSGWKVEAFAMRPLDN